jgi:mannose-6-phosphate isomerase
MGKPSRLYPFTFEPILKERVWGGRNLERLYAKPLPARVPIGESWEITDRPEGVSVIANGPLAGRTLRWLQEQHATELLGPARAPGSRFPLLIKILDATERLSLQVHPPADRARELGGEPKTEMWYVAEARPGADLFVGLRHGTTRAEFERRIREGTVAGCFHRIGVKSGDAMVLPSGRVHALGAGNVIFEVQQNSDTTYRVFDWNRAGLDGKPRELHLGQSLASIDFQDFEPGLVAADWQAKDGTEVRRLAVDPLFTVDLVRATRSAPWRTTGGVATILGTVRGGLIVRGSGHEVAVAPGGFCLVPACLTDAEVELEGKTEFLQIVPG